MIYNFFLGIKYWCLKFYLFFYKNFLKLSEIFSFLLNKFLVDYFYYIEQSLKNIYSHFFFGYYEFVWFDKWLFNYSLCIFLIFVNFFILTFILISGFLISLISKLLMYIIYIIINIL